MNKFFLVCLMFIGISVHGSATSDFTIVDGKIPNITLQTSQKIEVLTKQILSDNIGIKKSKQAPQKLPQCWIVPISCSCERFTTQYCNEGLRGTLEEWADRICCEGCGDGCISV